MNTTELVAAIRACAMIPDNDEDWTAAVVRDRATHQLHRRFTQVIPNLRSGHWLHRQTLTATPGVSEYRIPHRAITQGLEAVEVSRDGATWQRLVARTAADVGGLSTANGDPYYFATEADYVVLYPAPASAVPLRMSYYLRPGTLQAVSALGTVVSAPTAATIRVSGDPTSLIGASGTLDVVNTTGNNEVALVDVPFSGIAAVGGGLFAVTVTGGQSLQRVAAGQVLRAAGYTDYVPLPLELHEPLAQRVASVYLLEHGDTEQAGALAAAAENSIKQVIDAAAPRVKAQPFRVKSGSFSYLRRRYG